MLKAVCTVLVAVILSVSAVSAQSDAETNAQMETNFGVSAPFAEAFDEIKAAFASGDAATVARWVAYPFRVAYDDEEIVAEDEDSFVAQYDEIVTPDIVSAVENQSYDTLLVNADGVMFGNGEVWMTLLCADADCKQSEVRIIAIQSVMLL